jgi:hypothetical protein
VNDVLLNQWNLLARRELVLTYCMTYTAHITGFAAIREQGICHFIVFPFPGDYRARGFRFAGPIPSEEIVPSFVNGCGRWGKINFQMLAGAMTEPGAILPPEQEMHVDQKRPLDQRTGREASHD